MSSFLFKLIFFIFPLAALLTSSASRIALITSAFLFHVWVIMEINSTYLIDMSDPFGGSSGLFLSLPILAMSINGVALSCVKQHKWPLGLLLLVGIIPTIFVLIWMSEFFIVYPTR